MRFLNLLLPLCLFPLDLWAKQIHSGHVIVQFKDEEVFEKKAFRLSHKNLRKVHKATHQIKVSSPQDWESLLDDPDVLYVEWDYFYTLSNGLSSFAPFRLETLSEDRVKDYAEMSGHLLQIQNQGSLEMPQPAPLTRGLTSQNGDSQPIIAVIDSGIDVHHFVFNMSQSLWTNPKERLNGIDDDGNGFIDDIHGWNFVDNNNNIHDEQGHGTQVSGVILGFFMDIFSYPIEEESPVKIMPLKAFGLTNEGLSSHLAKAVYYAVDQGADVLNLSFSSENYSHTLHRALNYAYEKGVSVVVAAGNDNRDLDQKGGYPAGLPIPGILSVASVHGVNQSLSAFSNYGQQKVVLATPGENILTTSLGGLYRLVSGTSISTPFISALVSYGRLQRQDLSSYDLSTVIEGVVSKKKPLESKLKSGGLFEADNMGDFRQLAGDFQSLGELPPYEEDVYLELAQVQFLGGGCGTIAYQQRRASFKKPKMSVSKTLWAFCLLFSPMLLVFLLRRKTGQEGRKYERISVLWPGHLLIEDSSLKGQITSFSLEGLAFQSCSPQVLRLQKGSSVTIQAKNTRLQAKVCWSSKRLQKIGLQVDSSLRYEMEKLLKQTS